MVANDVSIPREYFVKISEFFKEIGQGQHIFSLQWDLQWQKSPKILGSGKTHLYELICHPHIEGDQTKPFCFLKKISLIKKNWNN